MGVGACGPGIFEGLRSSAASEALSVSPLPATSDSLKPLEKVPKKKKRAIKSKCSNAISSELRVERGRLLGHKAQKS